MKTATLSAALLALVMNVAMAAEPAAATPAAEPATAEHVHEHGSAGMESKGAPAAKDDAKGMDCGQMHKKHHAKKRCGKMMDEPAKKPAK